MKNILVTGASGFIGRSLINRMVLSSNSSVYVTDKSFNTIFPYIPTKLDYVIHLAAVHRGNFEDQIYEENMAINQKLINLLNVHNLTSNIIFTSSVQEINDTAYGRSKRDGVKYLAEICKSWNKEFIKINLPNLFGPFAKPFHTSVVANFCKNIVDKKKSIVNNVALELLYVQDAIDQILTFEGCDTFETTKIYLPDLYELLEKMHKDIKLNKKIILNSTFEAQLFTTLMSYTND